MKLCRHSGVACFRRAHSFQPHLLYRILGGLLLSNTTVDSQYAITRDLQGIASGDKGIGALRSQRERCRPKHDVTERFMTSAEDMRLKTTLRMGLR
jgi:hypothetical protein